MTAVPHQQDAKLGPTVALPPLRGQVARNETDVLHVSEVPRAALNGSAQAVGTITRNVYQRVGPTANSSRDGGI